MHESRRTRVGSNGAGGASRALPNLAAVRGGKAKRRLDQGPQ